LARDQIDEYYLTVAEVAELLRLNQQTVRNWIDQGSLPALRVGRRVRIKRSDLDRLLTEGYNAGGEANGIATGPSAEDFWGGEPVGMAELAAELDREATGDGTSAASAVGDGTSAASGGEPPAAGADSPERASAGADAPEDAGSSSSEDPTG
jgi:excisionase family DNA binding protein